MSDGYIVIQRFMVDELGLSGSRLMAYAAIHGFSQGGHGCFTGSVGYLASWAGVKERAMQYALNSLIEDGLVERLDDGAGGRGNTPRLVAVVPGEMVQEPPKRVQKLPERVQKLREKGAKIAPDNIEDTLVDNKEIKEKDSPSPDSVEIPYGEIVSYLNERAGTSYRESSRKTRSLIHARFSEGFTFDDFKTVIDNKCRSWLGDTRMCAYLRPETLFGTKFEGYLNESSVSTRLGSSGSRWMPEIMTIGGA